MSQPDYDEYNHLVFEEKIATICAATIPFAAFFGLCLCLKLCCCLCDLSISRDRLRHPRGSNEPPDIGSVGRRQSLGEQPRIWDVSTAPRFPPRSEPGPQSESPGLGQGQGEDERHDVDSAADDREGTEWTEFLVSCVCSLHQYLPVAVHLKCSCLFSWISSHYLQTRCQMRMLSFLHPKRTVKIPSGPHRRPGFKSVSSSSCLPLSPRRTRSPAKSITHRGDTRLGLLTSHTTKTTNFLLGAPAGLSTRLNGTYVSPVLLVTST